MRTLADVMTERDITDRKDYSRRIRLGVMAQSYIETHWNEELERNVSELAPPRHISQALKKNCIIKTCNNCFYHTDGYCCCRDISDVVTTPNKCSDWLPVENSL